MTTKRKIALIIVGAIALSLIAAATYLGLGMRANKQYSDKISLGDRYMNSGDYTNAVLAYRDAIEMDVMDADAYLGLARIYILQGDSQNAVATLEEGITRTGSARLQLQLDNYKASLALGKGETDASEPTLNTAVLNLFGNNSYSDYRNRNSAGAGTASGTSSVVYIEQLGASLTFSNNEAQPAAVLNGTIQDKSLPTQISMDNVMDLFGGFSSITFGQLKNLDLPNLLYREDQVHNYVVVFTANGCDVEIECDSAGTVSSGAWNSIVPEKALDGSAFENSAFASTVTGAVIDAVTGDGVVGVSMIFREGYAQFGDSIVETVTDNYGHYEVGLESGPYTVELYKDGYTRIYKEVYVSTYQTDVFQDFTLSPDVATEEIRIVLEWDSYPPDLDSYLGGTTDSGTSIWLMYSNPYETDAQGNPIASLDLDCRNGYGPETTTIHDPNGVYNFTVADFFQTDQMAQYGATVTVYMPNESPVVITLTPDSGVRSIWNVCQIDHGKLTVINSAPPEDEFTPASK